MILALKSAGENTRFILLDDQGKVLSEKDWQSGRSLAEGLLGQILDFLKRENTGLAALKGFIAFRGPGSFTSLRIVLATVNALAYALAVPNAGAEGEEWVKDGLGVLAGLQKPQIITPLYDRGPNITQPKR